MKLAALDAFNNSRANLSKKFPDRKDLRFQDTMLVPAIYPKFQFSTPCKVFTIGSCFARNIEEALSGKDVNLPTTEFSAPHHEWPYRSNGLLNEYNPGTMSQRILLALNNETYSDETIVETTDGFIDLLLPGGAPVTLDRAKERRSEIDVIYNHLKSSDLIIITLGLVEAWYDEKCGVFLNRIPPVHIMKKEPNRYLFRRLDTFEAYSLMNEAIEKLIHSGISRILLTVSPVPLNTTFTNKDAVIANTFSKSVLRICAEMFENKFAQVDYFPSYEMVNSCGLTAFAPDNIHVKDQLVGLITQKMLDSYLTNSGTKL